MKLLEGKPLAAELQKQMALDVQQLHSSTGIVPRLAAVLVGDDPASQVYVRNKRRACERVGMESELHRLPVETSTEQLLRLIDSLNGNGRVHGILVQLPLPAQMDAQQVLDAVHPRKDVDCFHPENVGLLLQGRPRFLPCTPQGVIQLLHHHGLSVQGKHVVIVGRSDIVGKPLAVMLMQRDSTLGPAMANATVTVCHSRSQDLAEVARQADILVVAVGRAALVGPEMVRPGAVVVDVGINRTDAGLVGDVDFPRVAQQAAAITPVPGGVGPLTIAMLLHNTITAAQAQRVAPAN